MGPPDDATEPIRFFLPGPAYVTEATRATMTAPVVAHRSPPFKELWQRMGRRLRAVFRTERDVPIATGSATLVMELALVSTLRSSVLHLVNGAFSERWHTIGRSLGKASDRLDVPWGRAVDPDLVRRALRRKGGRKGRESGGYEAVTVVQNETSTGVINPVEEIAAAVREESDALVLVDAVSSLGGVPLETDGWGLDLVVTGSQKALAAPPGLVPFAVSARAEERAGAVEHRGFYTDLLRYLEKNRQGGPITTPAIPVAYALDRQLAKIEEEGIEARWARHAHLQGRVEEWIGGGPTGRGGRGGDLGFSFAAAEGARSPTVSCLRPPAGLAARDLLARLAARGFTVAGGYGAWKESTFRIGHMGEVTTADLDALLSEIESVVEEG